MFGAARAAFLRNFSSPEFWSDVRDKGSLFVRVACLVHVVRSYGIEATAVRLHSSAAPTASPAVIDQINTVQCVVSALLQARCTQKSRDYSAVVPLMSRRR